MSEQEVHILFLRKADHKRELGLTTCPHARVTVSLTHSKDSLRFVVIFTMVCYSHGHWCTQRSLKIGKCR